MVVTKLPVSSRAANQGLKLEDRRRHALIASKIQSEKNMSFYPKNMSFYPKNTTFSFLHSNGAELPVVFYRFLG